MYLPINGMTHGLINWQQEPDIDENKNLVQLGSGITMSSITWYCIQHCSNKVCALNIPWCHDMETLSALLTLYEGNRSVTGGFHSQMLSLAWTSSWTKQDMFPLVWDAMMLMWCDCNVWLFWRKLICYNETYLTTMDINSLAPGRSE